MVTFICSICAAMATSSIAGPLYFNYFIPRKCKLVSSMYMTDILKPNVWRWILTEAKWWLHTHQRDACPRKVWNAIIHRLFQNSHIDSNLWFYHTDTTVQQTAFLCLKHFRLLWKPTSYGGKRQTSIEGNKLQWSRICQNIWSCYSVRKQICLRLQFSGI
jgi:hypothetical protein